jgi:hypothetical protein
MTDSWGRPDPHAAELVPLTEPALEPPTPTVPAPAVHAWPGQAGTIVPVLLRADTVAAVERLAGQQGVEPSEVLAQIVETAMVQSVVPAQREPAGVDLRRAWAGLGGGAEVIRRLLVLAGRWSDARSEQARGTVDLRGRGGQGRGQCAGGRGGGRRRRARGGGRGRG